MTQAGQFVNLRTMKKSPEQILTEGLLAGFVGGKVLKTNRGGFSVESSHFVENDAVYHDEWIAGRLGGGQELVEVGGAKFTRLYAGGVIGSRKLSELGVTEKEVMEYLAGKLKELSDQTRLLKTCLPKPDGEWQYSYIPKGVVQDIPLTQGLERIDYKNKMVFAHAFLLSPVK